VTRCFGFTGSPLGSLGEKEIKALSEIIQTLNDRLGHELTEADRLVIEQHVLTATADEDRRSAAKANTLESEVGSRRGDIGPVSCSPFPNRT
jgi:hypothetical protein